MNNMKDEKKISIGLVYTAIVLKNIRKKNPRTVVN